MKPTVRFATRNDAPAYLALIRALADFEKLPGPDDGAAQRLIEDAFGPAPKYEVLVGELDGEVIAYAIFFPTYSTFLARPGLYLEDLFVRPEYRGRGYGKALLLHLAKLANARGCGRMEWSVLDWNQPAIEFYESIGAKRMTEWQICRLTGEALRRYA